MEHFDQASAAAPPGDSRFDAIRRRLDDVMGGEAQPPVDVRAYLLDPPPTPEESLRLERRRVLVRRGSLVACALLGVILFAPWPSGDAGAPSPQVAADGSESESQFEPEEPSLPVRVDAAPRAAAAPVRRAQRRRHGAHQRPQRAVARPSTVSRPAPTPSPAPAPQAAQPTPAPRPNPAPATPAPAPSSDAGVLVPVI